MIYIKLLATVTIIDYIMNHSGFLFDFTKMVYKRLNPGVPYMGQPLPKPFSCSSCMIFWITTVIGIIDFGWTFGLLTGVISSISGLYINKLLKWIIKYGN